MIGIREIPILTHSDNRGWVSNLLDFLPIDLRHLKNIHIVSMGPGVVRGNHLHAKQREALCVLGKQVRFRAMNPSTGEKVDKIAADNPPLLFFVQPGIAHAFKNEGTQVAHLVCFTDQTYDFEHPDVTVAELFE